VQHAIHLIFSPFPATQAALQFESAQDASKQDPHNDLCASVMICDFVFEKE